jgi:hypothetical protein
MATEKIEDWAVVYETNSEIKAEMIRTYLKDSEIESMILNQRDHSIRVNLPNAELVKVLVPSDQEAQAKLALEAMENLDGEEDDL